MIIEVKEFKGLATNADPNDIGLEFSRINTNFSLDTLGTLTKQKGRGSHTDLSGIQISQLQYWSPSNLDINNAEIPAVWVGFDATNKKINRLNNHFSSPTDLGSAVTATSVVDLNDHGQDFRIASDNLVNPPKILQHISRKFFEGAVNVNEFVFQDATPSLPPASQIVIDGVSAITVGADTGLSLGVASSANSYSYKISPIFDGLQELPLTDDFMLLSVSDDTKAGKITVKFINLTSSGTAPNKTYSFNPRITSFKVYRETNHDDNYYQILEIPINTANGNDNTVVDGSVGGETSLPGKDYSYSNTLIDNNTAVKNATGVFSTPNQTVASNTLTARYVWKHVMRLSNGTLDSNSNVRYSQSPTIAISDFASVSGTTANFSSVNGPLSNSTFSNFLDNGFLQLLTSSHPSDSASAFNFNTDTQIRRLLETTRPATGGGTVTEFIDANDFNHTLQNTVWHNKAIGYNMNNTKRWGPGGANGYISVDHNSNQNIVLNSVGKSVLLEDASGYVVGQNIDLYKNYVLTVGASTTTYDIYDIGYTNSFLAPFLGTDATVDTRYKYSQMIGDMHFVGNVKLDPNGNPEDHPDFVMFSESGQPDIIPTTNFIRILDQQGGSIIGMNRILNNLVVFMTRGIFRLDVSSGDPSLFTLLEVNTGIGCVAPESIVNAQDNLFFCSKDNIYQIRSDFTFIPISKSIEDTYQGIANISSSKIIYDIKRDRLICTLGNDHTNIFMYDLINQEWTKLNFDDSNFKTANFFTVNDDLGLFTVDVYST